MTNGAAGLQRAQRGGKKHSNNKLRSDLSVPIVNQQLVMSISAFSPHYSYFTASANGHQRPASFCHAPCLHFISLCCMCVCVSSPEWASHKQMGSWKATSHIVTEKIPFFCPRSWWHWWPCHTDQTRPEGGHHFFALTQTAHPPKLVDKTVSSQHPLVLKQPETVRLHLLVLYCYRKRKFTNWYLKILSRKHIHYQHG